MRQFQDLIDELNNRDRTDTGFGFNLAVATLTATGTIQLVDDVSGATSTDLTFIVTEGASFNTVTVNSSVTTAGNRESATVSVANGPTTNVEAGQTLTLFGDTALSTTGVAPRVTLRFGSGFTVGTDVLDLEANVFQGALNGGTSVEFSPGDTVTFLAGSGSVSPAERLQRLTLDFDSIIDVTALSSSGGETFILSATSRPLSLQIGGGSSDTKYFALSDVRTKKLGTSASNNLDNVDVTTITGATAALDVIDDALDQVTQVEGRLGAISARLEDHATYLDNYSLNIQGARSQIISADIAQEATELALNTVFLEAQTAVLVQANAVKENVLKILYGLD